MVTLTKGVCAGKPYSHCTTACHPEQSEGSLTLLHDSIAEMVRDVSLAQHDSPGASDVALRNYAHAIKARTNGGNGLVRTGARRGHGRSDREIGSVRRRGG